MVFSFNSNPKKAKDELTKNKHLLQETIKEVLRGFWVDVAKRMNVTYGPQRKLVDTWLKFQNAIRSVSNIQEGKIICEIVYVSLNFVFNYRDQIAKAALAFCKLRIVNSKRAVQAFNGCDNGGRRTRKKRPFIEKLILQMQTDLRKNINEDSRKTSGFTYTKQNPDGDDGSRLKDKHRHLKFYDWMILGTYVRMAYYVTYQNSGIW
jgi:hypothetical protein